jgi:hypothetical protein
LNSSRAKPAPQYLFDILCYHTAPSHRAFFKWNHCFFISHQLIHLLGSV